MKEDKVNTITDQALLYSLWSGEFRVAEGSVFTVKGFEKYGTFRFNDRDKIVTCHLEPEKVYNAMVWLPERDDQKAIQILLKYHENKIKELKEKINGHLKNMGLIRGGIKHE